MLFNSIRRNVKVTLLCITDTPTMLYTACPEKFSFGGRRVGDSDPLFLNFLYPPLKRAVNIGLHNYVTRRITGIFFITIDEKYFQKKFGSNLPVASDDKFTS